MTTQDHAQSPASEPRDFGPLVNLDAEVALLAAIMTRNEIFWTVQPIIEARCFASPVHGRIFSAIGRLLREGTVANVITLKAEFDQDPDLKTSGGSKYLVRLAAGVVSLLNADDYAITIRDLWLRREIAQIYDGMNAILADPQRNADELIAEQITALYGIAKHGKSTASGKRAIIERIYNRIVNPPQPFSTGIERLDLAMGGGLYPGKFYAFGARKKTGKTALLNTISHNLNRLGIQHGFINAEMPAEQVEERNLARELGVNPIVFLRNPSRDLALRVVEYMATAPDYTLYEDAPGCFLDDLQRICGRLVVQHGVKGIILDYWQMVRGRQKSDTQEQHQANVAAFLANFSRKHGIFIITAAQTNQEGNSRGGEGIKLECDMYFQLHREKGNSGAWLEMEESRYAPYQNIGAEDQAAIFLHDGAYFDEEFRDPRE